MSIGLPIKLPSLVKRVPEARQYRRRIGLPIGLPRRLPRGLPTGLLAKRPIWLPRLVQRGPRPRLLGRPVGFPQGLSMGLPNKAPYRAGSQKGSLQTPKAPKIAPVPPNMSLEGSRTIPREPRGLKTPRGPRRPQEATRGPQQNPQTAQISQKIFPDCPNQSNTSE